MKRLGITLASLTLATSMMANTAYADAAVGDVIVTLGADLNTQQKSNLLKEMGAASNSNIITVSNEEEHRYLGNYLSKAQIGSKALSSSKITIGAEGSGIEVKTNHIKGVTEELFANALITGGAKDVNVYITAPFEVSGTAALTGIMKAYEASSDTKIPEAQKQIANEELAKSAELSDQIGADKTAALMTTIKEKIAEENPQTEEEMKQIISLAAAGLDLTLTDEAIMGLVNLFMKMKELDIDWNQVGQQLEIAKEKFTNFFNSEEGKNLFSSIKQFFVAVSDAVRSLFK